MATHDQHSRFNMPFFGRIHRHKAPSEPEFSGFLSPQQFGEAIEDAVSFSGAHDTHPHHDLEGEPHDAGLTAMNKPGFFSLSNPFQGSTH